jgi:hypothetical protein
MALLLMVSLLALMVGGSLVAYRAAAASKYGRNLKPAHCP